MIMAVQNKETAPGKMKVDTEKMPTFILPGAPDILKGFPFGGRSWI